MDVFRQNFNLIVDIEICRKLISKPEILTGCLLKKLDIESVHMKCSLIATIQITELALSIGNACSTIVKEKIQNF